MCHTWMGGCWRSQHSGLYHSRAGERVKSCIANARSLTLRTNERVISHITSAMWDTTPSFSTGWQRPIGCLKSQVIFCKRATNYRALLLKMTYEDKASYDSTPACNVRYGIFNRMNESCRTLRVKDISRYESINESYLALRIEWARHVVHYECKISHVTNAWKSHIAHYFSNERYDSSIQ